MAKDPICGMEVTETQAASSLEYKGRKFLFCAPACYETFKKDPEKFLAPSKKRGWMGRFLNRLAQASTDTYGEKPPKCH